MTDNLLISQIIDDKEVVDYYGLFNIDVPNRHGKAFYASMEYTELLQEFCEEYNLDVHSVTNVDFLFTVKKFVQV